MGDLLVRLRYGAQRLSLTVLTLVLVSLAVFVCAQVLPGDLGRTILGQYATPEQVAQLNHQLGADQPILQRYLDWAVGFVTGDWGHSPILNQEVRPLVLDRLGNSGILAAFAFVLIVPLSIACGIFAGLRHGRWPDKIVLYGGLSMIALPEFVVGVALIFIFAVELGWFPVFSEVPSANPVDLTRQLLLPSIPLMMIEFGYISRIAREGTLEVLGSAYTRTAVLKGLPRQRALTHHVMPNALIPTVSVVTAQIGYFVGGVLVIEALFNYPGIGKLAYDSAVSHDIVILTATTIVIAVIVMLSNLLADMLFRFLNPVVRLAR